MSRWRSSMLLLGVAVVAIVIGFLRVITEPTALPTGSSYSAQPDGALALYSWLSELGAQPTRLSSFDSPRSAGSVFIVEPVSVGGDQSRQMLDAVGDRGGTIVLAGDSIPWLLQTRNLGVTVEPSQPAPDPAQTPDGLRVPLSSRYRVRADGAQPLLVLPNGDWAALRKPYRQGTLVVIVSPEPLTNAGLADADTARFVFRDVASPVVASGQSVAFDEINRPPGIAVGAPETPSLSQLLFATAPGRAVLYAALVVFVFLLLAGRRLGPAIVPRSPAQSQRTMYEHVQMLADLYRRAGQFGALRNNLGRQYARHSPATAARIAAARNEAELITMLADAAS